MVLQGLELFALALLSIRELHLVGRDLFSTSSMYVRVADTLKDGSSLLDKS